MDTLEVLMNAREEVQKGWCQHQAVDLDGNVCAMGAVEAALGEPRTFRTACLTVPPRAVCVALQDAIPDEKVYSVPIFNDLPGTTKADVLALFDRAINAKVTSDPAHVYTTAA